MGIHTIFTEKKQDLENDIEYYEFIIDEELHICQNFVEAMCLISEKVFDIKINQIAYVEKKPE
jgi:hypothetical protein